MSRPSNATGGRFSHWLVRMLRRLLLLVLAFVAGAVAMHVGMHGGDAQHMQMLEAQVAALQAERLQAQADRAADQSRAAIDSGTLRSLQEKTAELQEALGQTQDQLAFYEQLIPPGPAGSVAIRAFEIAAEGEFLSYRVLLTRNARPDAAEFKGRLRFVAHGMQDGKPVKMVLLPPGAPDSAAPAAHADPLALDFRQFQRSTGLLQAVPGQSIDTVQLEILEGDTVRAAQEAPVAQNGKQP